MRISRITPIIAKRYMSEATRKRALYIRGASGIGKSEVVRQAGALLAEHVPDWQGVVEKHLGNMDPTDGNGVPWVDKEANISRYARPEWIPRTGAGILFLDELSSAPPSMQAFGYSLILTPWLYGIPKEWMVVAAGNNKSDRGVTFNLAGPLQNRLCDISVVNPLDDWIDHALKCSIRPEILSFLKDRGDLLHKFEAGGEMKPFPSHRAWFSVSDTMDLDLPQSERVECIKGDVGEEAAGAFETHLRLWETIPRIDDILAGEVPPMPKDMSARYCVAMGLATRLDKDNFNNAWNFLSTMPGDVQTLTIKLAHGRDKKIAQASKFATWATTNQAAFNRG